MNRCGDIEFLSFVDDGKTESSEHRQACYNSDQFLHHLPGFGVHTSWFP